MKTFILLLLVGAVIWLISPILPAPPDLFHTSDNISSDNATLVDKVIDWGTGTSQESIERRVEDLYSLTNAERIKYGMKPLKKDTRLENLAQGHAEDMYQRNSLDHNGFDRRADSTNYSTFGENCAEGGYEASSFIDMWMTSPGHKDNILNSDFDYIGIGIYGKYAVQDFGG